MPLDERDYREKNTWRRWTWNRVVERLAVPTRDAIVLYLAAARNLDACEATRRGFRKENLIAVDRDVQKIKSLREGGVNCIQGDIFSVARTWREPVHVLHLDFCCGAQSDLVVQLVQLMYSSHVQHAVLCLNLLRGRDSSINDYRLCYEEIARSNGMTPSAAKHRGFMAYCAFLAHLGHGLRRIGRDRGVSESETNELIEDFRLRLIKVQRWVTTSYRSSTNQTFDTIVFRNPLSLYGEIGLPIVQSGDIDDAVARRVSAFRAHRTRNIANLPKH